MERKRTDFAQLLIRIFIVGTGVPDGPQNTNFGRELVFSADLCYNDANEKPSSGRFRGNAKHARRASDEFFLFRTAKGPIRRETGGTRQGFPEANEMSFGGSLRCVTEGACVTLDFE